MPKKYIKDMPEDPFVSHVNYNFASRTTYLPSVLLSLGILVIITQVILPLYFFTSKDKISSPVAGSILGVATGFSNFQFSELSGVKTNYTVGNTPSKFYLTVPKLGISKAAVHTNSTDMSPDDFIGHYMGSALPGEVGNVFLYGHSVLPVFYNPRNYKAIFSTLDKLEPGDEVTVEYNNKTYVYKVESTDVLAIENVNPLGTIKPGYLNDSTLVLMTCWPPGLKSKRLQVNTVLVN